MMRRMMKKLLCCLMLAAVICGSLWTGDTASAAGPAKGPDEGVKDICVFLPYDGTSEEVIFSALAATGKRLAECTGGNLIQYKGAAATIDALADAVESSAVVIIGSHGLSGFITLTTDAGLTKEDKDGHVYSLPTKLKSDNTIDYQAWAVDGRAIANHMTKKAPNNLILLECCMSMQTELFCKPMREKGVAVVFGFSESVISFGADMMIDAVAQSLCSGRTMAQAFSDMQADIGRWDPIFNGFSLSLAQSSNIAFPIVVSEEDAYPGVGKVNQVQTVKSGWMLPVRTDMPQKLILPLGFNIGSRTIAYNCKSAKITVGSLPQGISLRVMGDGTLCLQGTPTKKGYSVATIQIVTTKNRTVTKPVGIMVADEANVTVLPLKEVTYQSGDTVNIPLEFTSNHVNTFVLRKYAGFLPYTMTYEAESAFGRWRILSSLVPGNPKLRYTASPGQYEITLDMITYPSGDVYRRPVRITVKHKETKNVEMSIHATQYEELTTVVDGNTVEGFRFGSNFSSLDSLEITGGYLPTGLHLRATDDLKLGLYGTPVQAGDFTLNCRVSANQTLINLTLRIHVDSNAKLPGGAKLQWDDGPKVVLSGVPATRILQWQKAGGASGPFSFSDIDGETDLKLKTKNYGNRYLRTKITAPGYGGALYSDVQYVEILEGSVCYTSGIAVGKKVTTGITGQILELYHTAPDRLHYQWRKRKNEHSSWVDIPGATKSSYTPVEDDATHEIQLVVSADWYTSVCSTPRLVPKMVNDQEPVLPQLSLNTYFYNSVMVKNPQPDQEYCLTYTLGSVDWSTAVQGGAVKLSAEKDKTVYVYTRMKETETRLAGTKVIYAQEFNGAVDYLTGLSLNKTSVTTKAGDVTMLTVNPIPQGFSGWTSDFKVKWLVNGKGVELYSDSACTNPVTPGELNSAKTVYVKATEQTAHVEVAVEKSLGPTQVYYTYCSFEVADADGNFIPQYLLFDDAKVFPGESTTVSYTPYPSPAKVGALSFTKTQGESDLTLTDNGDGTVTVTAPASAKTGDYSYNVKISGVDSQYISTIRIIVAHPFAKIIIDNGKWDNIIITVPIRVGGIFALPELPERIRIPRGSAFAGWDLGAVGDLILITEDTVIQPLWKDHTHRMKFVPAAAAACGKAGNPAYYWCEDCEMAFSDELGTQHLNSESIMIAALEHVAGTPVKENVREADASGLGSYETAVYCTVCGEEMTRTYTTVTPAGHELVEVPEKEAGCAEEGIQAHWFCQVCGRLFADAEGKNEITDLNEICLPALGHAWGEWAVSKPATATEEGEETRVCARCGEQETRKAGEEETTYSFTKGAGGAWTKGSAEGLEFTVTGSPDDANTFARFTGLEMDGNAVAKEAYTAAKGSVIISLKASYLETLPEGAHTLKAIFADGKAEAGFTVSAAAKPVDPTKFDDVAVPSDTFTFKKVWMGDTEKSIDFTLYKQGGEVYHHGFDKKMVSNREWRYNAWFSSPTACYVIEKPIPGYQTKYVNVGVYAHVTDRCCDGGTIINKKIPKTGDESSPVLWAGLTLAGIAGLTALVLVKKRGKNGK